MAQQKFTFKLSKKYGEAERFAIGQEVIDFIIKRSKAGKDKKNKDFVGYSDGYVKSFDFKKSGKSKNKVNLTLSGEMLNALEVLDYGTDGEVTIGIPKADTFNNDKAEGNITGSYGQKRPNSKKARDFMGIHRDDLNAIKADYPIKTKADRENTFAKSIELLKLTEASEELVDGFLSFEND